MAELAPTTATYVPNYTGLAPVALLEADPPWAFGDKLSGKGRGAEKNYRVLPTDQICSYPLPPIATNAILLLWRVGAMQEEALQVCRAWGFRPTTDLVWVKTRPCTLHWPQEDKLPASDDFRMHHCHGCTRNWLGEQKLHFGMGRTLRNCQESAIVGVRGSAGAVIRNRSLRSVVFAPYLGHSRKPEEASDLMEALTPGPYCRLFSRRHRPNWYCFGDELPPQPEQP